MFLLAAFTCTPKWAAAQIFSLRTDALAALTATVHVGAEVSVADKWTVEVSGYWNPIRTTDFSTRFHAVQLGSRYWVYESFVGHFLGSHLAWISYNLGNRTKRYRGHAYGLGFSYGYAWMISKRWNVSIETGIGLFRSKDTRSDPTVGDWEDEYIYHYQRWTVAPSKLEISFSYLF